MIGEGESKPPIVPGRTGGPLDLNLQQTNQPTGEGKKTVFDKLSC